MAKPADGDTLSLSTTRLREQAAYDPQKATHLISVDFDGTLSTDITGAAQFQRHSGNHLLHINTGRSVEDLASVAHRLKALKIYAISASNGEGLYVNRYKLSGERFVRKIRADYQRSQGEQDFEWVRQIKDQTGWEHQRVADIVQAFIKKGLVCPGYGVTECFANSSGAPVKILAALREAKINADFTVEDRNLYKFGPKNYEKNSPVQFLAAKCPVLKQVIVAGDSFNDQSLMRMVSVKNANHASVPVTRILMDSNAEFVKNTLTTAPNPESVTLVNSSRNKLFDVVEKQYDLEAKPLSSMNLA